MNIPFSISILFFLSNKVASSPALTQLIVTRVGPCLDRKPTEVVAVTEMSLHKEKFGTSLSGPMWIHEAVENGWIVKATMQKCHDIRNLDTCDFYKSTIIISGGCENPDAEDQEAFKMFARFVTPRLSCPIKPGNYTVNKYQFFTTGSILTTGEAKISTSVFGYTYRIEGLDDEEERIFCVDSSLRMVYIRKHDWIGSQTFEEELPTTKIGDKVPATNTGRDKSDGDEFEESGAPGQTDEEVNESEVKGSKADEENGETNNESEETVRKAEEGEIKDELPKNTEIATKTKGRSGETNDEMGDTKDVGGEIDDSSVTEGHNKKTDTSKIERDLTKPQKKSGETIAEHPDTEDEEIENSANKGETRSLEKTVPNTGGEKEIGETIDEESENEGKSQPQPEEEAGENEDDE